MNANPTAGTDISRLVAYASIIDNVKKTDIIRRVILALNASRVDEILIMPDYCNLGDRVLGDVRPHGLRCRAYILDMLIIGDAEDSVAAAHLMSKQGVDCIITSPILISSQAYFGKSLLYFGQLGLC